MTNVCKVHGNTLECVSCQLAKLKIAVALVVIRNKPADQNIKDFVHNLVFFQQDRVSVIVNTLLQCISNFIVYCGLMND